MESTTTTRLIELSDGQQRKPLKVRTDSCTIASLLKEAKNKFRKKQKHIVYEARAQSQRIRTDEELRRVLQHHDDGMLCLHLTNKDPRNTDEAEAAGHDAESQQSIVVATKSRGISYVIGNESTTEDAALIQLRQASELPGCIFAVGMPDLHPGKGIPIGAVVMTEENVAYPQLVDNDIGCGMSFVETSLSRGKLSAKRIRKIAASLVSIDSPFAPVEDMMELCSRQTQWGSRTLDPLPVLEPYHYKNLGTVGGGNHFAELQEFDDVLDADSMERYGIDTEKIHLLVHSGSRSLGSQYLKNFCERASTEAATGDSPSKHGHFGADTESDLFRNYLQDHNVALNFAARNRRLIAERLLLQVTGSEAQGEFEPTCKVDIYHNFLERFEFDSYDDMRQMAEQGLFPKEIPIESSENGESGRKFVGWIHRKGATPTTQSPILVIPGSRGSISYLVEVNRAAEHGSAYSLAHGAGRKMNRSKALKLHQGQYPNASQLLQTDLGGVVVCEKKELVYEEAPASYKDIDDVVRCLAEDVGVTVGDERQCLVRVLATLRPVLTYKYKNPYEHK